MSEWKLVPVDATQAMMDAGSPVKIADGHGALYRAMIDAAPVPTAADCVTVCDAYAAENQQFSAELARLRAENERLKADAERYEWLRDHCETMDTIADPDNLVQVWSSQTCHYGHSLDAAIAAAMAQGKV